MNERGIDGLIILYRFNFVSIFILYRQASYTLPLSTEVREFESDIMFNEIIKSKKL